MRTTRPRPVPSKAGGRSDRRALGRLGAIAERATVTAVENEHQALRRAAIHPRGHIRGLDGRAGEDGAFRVPDCQIEVALLVSYAVAGEIEQQEIVAMLGIEESRDRPTDGREAFVQEGNDFVEGADAWGGEDFRQRADIDVRRGEPSEARVVVLTVPDDERELARHDDPGSIADVAWLTVV